MPDLPDNEAPGNDCLLLTGATASGKMAVAVEAARAVDGELISIDSMKIYRGLVIGAAAPTAERLGSIPCHLVGVADPREFYSVGRYVEESLEAVEGIRRRGRRPILVGGTVLYLRGLVEGIFEGPARDEGLRRQMAQEVADRGTAALHARLAEVDPVAAGRIHPHDARRIVRALEVYELTGRPISLLQADCTGPLVGGRIVAIRRPRTELYRRVDARVEAMFEAGLVGEVRALVDREMLGPTAAEALGYREVAGHLRGEYDLEEAVRLTKRNTRRFARKQLSHLARVPGLAWFDVPADESAAETARRLLEEE